MTMMVKMLSARQLLPTVVLLMAVATFFSYWTYLDRASVQKQKVWLSSSFGSLQHDDASVGLSDAIIQDDQRNMRSLLFPEQHIYRPAQTIRQQWNVTTAPATPDGVKRIVYMINGLFPGPTIEARSGDELEIEVHNLADTSEGISIHWHGLAMQGANEMDGVVGLTQCAIGTGQSYIYRFRISETQHGTFWYHAHSGVQLADGLYGGLIIHKPSSDSTTATTADSYDREQLLLIGDWYHRPAQDVLARYQDYSSFGNEPSPDSLLINGRGYFACSMTVPANPVDCRLVQAPNVTLYGQRTRLRVVNTGALAGFTLAIPHSAAQMRVLEVDGGGSVVDSPVAASVGILYPGERMDVVIERPASDDKAASLVVALDRENMHLKNFALTRTQSFHLGWHNSLISASSAIEPATTATTAHFNLADAKGAVQDGAVPLMTAQKAVVYTRVEILASHGNVPLGVVNRTSWLVDEPAAPPLLALDRSRWPHMRRPGETPPLGQAVRDVPWFEQTGKDEWMDLVVNNLDEKGHPFHLHGFSFFVVASWRSPAASYDAFNPFEHAAPVGGPMNTATPLRKDTVYVPRMGYVVLRFQLDNAGLWLLHCHMLWHHAAGMGMALQVGPAASLQTQQKAGAMCVS
ncbi:laccase iv [Grosmannia clavigera kw1407]|uniref:Laccase iv n=1 Tax=Grosmannia clavigera (strain kw1407 / UAMH 11150) TaxID=655863 RepID=F0XLH6_GROCL|nr:laccase iv [Grosmannia clavigera kw1407]EFX01145.1 laccase iv [Grosmannia clavigera kw1407]